MLQSVGPTQGLVNEASMDDEWEDAEDEEEDADENEEMEQEQDKATEKAEVYCIYRSLYIGNSIQYT